jgi:penicillin G amidase
MGDYQDLYVERLRRDGDTVWCRDDDGERWVHAQVRAEQVPVRGGDPVDVEVVRTPRGPVVLEDVHDTSFSLRRPADVLGDLGFDCLLPLLRARTADDVVEAFAGWVEPVNNLLVADHAGGVRHRVVGRVPRRDEGNRRVPVPVSADTRWRGWTDLPGSEVGPADHLVTANHAMPGFEVVGVDFAAPARAHRIESLLRDRDDLTVQDCAAIHADVLAGQPAHLHDALAVLTGLTGEAERLRRKVVAWDQRFDAASPGAAAYAAVRDELVRRIAADPALAGLDRSPYPSVLAPWMSVPVQVYLSLGRLLSPDADSFLPHRDDVLRDAVRAVAAGGTPYAEVPTWGERHRFRPPHALAVTGYDPRPDDPGTPLAGDNDCVRCAGQVPGTATVVRGSVARYVWDLRGVEHSAWVVPTGAHGVPGHPHHRDQLPLYRDAALARIGAAAGEGMELVTPAPDRTVTGSR